MTVPDWVGKPDPSLHNVPARFGGPLEAPLSQQQLQATVQFFSDTFIGNIAIAFGGIEIFGWRPFEFLVEWGEDRIAEANRNYQLALYNSSQLGVISVTGLASDVVGGVVVSADFNGPSATTLGSDFTRKAFGPGGGSFGPNGSGVAWWNKFLGNDRWLMDRHNTPLATDYQISRLVMATPPQTVSPWVGGEAYSYLGGRINSAFTDYVFAQVGRADLTIGCAVADVITVFDVISFVPNPGDTIEFVIGTDVDDYEFVVKRQGIIVWRGTDSSHVSQIGLTHLYVGLGSKAANRSSLVGFNTDQTVPGVLDSWAAADRQPATI